MFETLMVGSRRLCVAPVLVVAASLALAAPAAAGRTPPKILQGSYTANVFMVRPAGMVFWSPVVKDLHRLRHPGPT
jgi:hypothetical protein